jgi:DNA-binding CsgD family transcriptional regulator
VDAIFARAQGNPFFTEELLAAARHGSQQLPTTLRDLLRGRLEALSGQAQHVLAVAAVAGRRIPHWLLAASANMGEPQLEDALREAVDGRLLMTQPGEDGYEFRHALLREVIIARLLPGQRIRLHAAIAAAMAAQPSRAIGSDAPVAAELSYHWYAAGDLERALPATIRAAVQAEQALAFAEAFRHYKHALGLWEKVPRAAELVPVDRPTLLEQAAEAGYRVNADPQAAQLLRAALASVDPTTNPGRASLLHERLGRYLWLALDGTALSSYEEAVRLLPAGPPSTQRARVLAGYAQMLCVLARYAECQRVSEEALGAARHAKARQEEGRALAVLGAALTFLGSPDEGLSHLARGRTLAEEQGDIEGLGWACYNLAYANERAGRLNEALAIALDGGERCRQLGASSWQDGLQAAVGDLEWRLGNWERAGQHLAGVLERDRLTQGGAVQARCDRALLDIGCGEFDTARQWLEEADLRVATAGPAQFAAQFAGPLALARTELALWRGRDEEAYRTAIAGLAASGVNKQASRPTLFALAMAAAANRADRARAHRDAATVMAAEHDGDQLFEQLQAHASADSPARGPELAVVVVQCRAERARLHGSADPNAWAAVAACWHALDQPYEASRARFRQAEALLASRAPRIQVEEVLGAALAVATQLGAAPLRRELESLAQRGRLRLPALTKPAAAEPEPTSAARSLGLTRREAEVLQLVAAGRTNRQIGQALFITEKTASLHVSHILTKLGVAGRGEAAAIAHRLGLDKE